MKTFIQSIALITLLSSSALAGCNNKPGAPGTPEVETKKVAPRLHIKLEAIQSVEVGNEKVKFEQFSVCKEANYNCLPVVFVYDKTEELVYVIAPKDKQDLKISSVTPSEFANVRASSSPNEEVVDFSLETAQKNIEEVNEQTLSRCRHTHDWTNLSKLNRTPRGAVYFRFDLPNLDNQVLFRLDSRSGVVTPFHTKENFSYNGEKRPTLVLNVPDQKGELAIDNALITFEKHQFRCQDMYKQLKYEAPEYDTEVDQKASTLLNFRYGQEVELHGKQKNDFEGASYSQALYPESVQEIKTEK